MFYTVSSRFKDDVDYPEQHFRNKREMLSQESVDFEGKQISVSKYVVDDPCHRYDGLKASDFALENLIAQNVPLEPVMCKYQISEITQAVEIVNANNALRNVQPIKINENGIESK